MYTKSLQLNSKDREFYGVDKMVFTYQGKKPRALPNVRDILPDLPELITEYHQLTLSKTDKIKFWAHVKIHGLYFSVSNSKVAKGAWKNGYKSPAAFGKTYLATCLYPSELCKSSCYQRAIQDMYKASRNAHLWNALIMANGTMEEILDAGRLSLDRLQPDVIRLLDDGDNSQPAEIVLWDTLAKEYPGIRFYGYTKAGELIHMAKMIDTKVIWNLSSNGDDTSQAYVKRLAKYFKVCHIRYTEEHDAAMPFNNEESVAMMTFEECYNEFNTTEFQIGYHGYEFYSVDRFYHNLEKTLPVKVC